MGTRRANREGTYTVRPNGRVQYRVMVDGRRIVTTGRNRREAKAEAERQIRLMGDARAATTVSALLDEWVADGAKSHGLRPTTFDQYRTLVGRHVIPALGSTRVDQVDKRDVAATLRDFTGSASSKRSTYAAMVKLWDYAVDRGLVGVNVVREVKRPAAAQALAILKAAKEHRWEVAVWLGLGAGLRRGEMLGLRWSDVDLDKAVAHVRLNVTRTSAGLIAGEPKTSRGVRDVPLGDEVVAALRAHRATQAAERLKAGSAWADSGHVITNEVGGLGEPRQLSRVWSAWARKAKVKDRGTHTGRHFAATQLLASGRASVADVAAILGHDPSVLLGVYASAVAEGQRAAVSALGEVLAAEPQDEAK